MSATRTPDGPLPLAPEPADRATAHGRRQPDRPRRLRPPRARGPARGDDRRHRLRGRDRPRGRRPPRRPDGIAAAVVSAPSLRALRRAGRGLPRRGPRRGADGRRRGRDPPGLAGDDRLRRRLRRHDRLRRLGAGRGSLRPLRHHRRRRWPTPPRASSGAETKERTDGPHHPATASRPRRRARLRRAGLQHQQHGAGPCHPARQPRATDAPVILQASRGARSYAGDVMLRHMVEALAEMYPRIPICLHQDHGNDEATCLSAIRHGFTSRDDGRLARGRHEDPGLLRLQRRASPPRRPRWPTPSAPRSRASSACLGSPRDRRGRGRGRLRRRGRPLPRPAPDRPRPGGRLRRRTRVDALAIACGTSHGAYKFTRQPDGDILAMDVIEAIHAKLPDTHLVMHGSSSVPQALQDMINDARRRDAADLGRAGRGDRPRHPPSACARSTSTPTAGWR